MEPAVMAGQKPCGITLVKVQVAIMTWMG